jgi:hypothetical protein
LNSERHFASVSGVGFRCHSKKARRFALLLMQMNPVVEKTTTTAPKTSATIGPISRRRR